MLFISPEIVKKLLVVPSVVKLCTCEEPVEGTVVSLVVSSAFVVSLFFVVASVVFVSDSVTFVVCSVTGWSDITSPSTPPTETIDDL